MGAVDLQVFRAVPQHVAMLSCPRPAPCVFAFSNTPAGVVVIVDSVVHCESCRSQLVATLREITGAIRRRQSRTFTRRALM